MPLWSSRFAKPLAASALQYSSSIETDKRLYDEDIEGSKAHVRMLVKTGIITSSEGRKIRTALDQIRKEIAEGKLKPERSDEDIHTVVEQQLVKKLGILGKKLHTARSRNDQVALDERLYLRKEIVDIRGKIAGFQLALLRQAEEHKRTIVPGYTHLQRAQPILFAHHLLAYVSMLQRDSDRFVDCQQRVNLSPLGAAALAGTSLPIDRIYTARILKMNGIIENSIDAVSDRDVLLECISACAITMMHLSRFAEEMVMWSSHEFSFAAIDESFTTGSSLMPQKKNPDIAELIRGKVGRVYGDLMSLFTVMKGLPLAYNRDLQEDKAPMFDAMETTESSLSMAAEMLARTKFKHDRFEKELSGDMILATDMADYLVRKGVPFRSAHEIVGKMVQDSIRRRISLGGLSLEEMRSYSPQFDLGIFAVLEPLGSIRARRSAGGTSGSEVAKQLRRWRGKVRKALRETV